MVQKKTSKPACISREIDVLVKHHKMPLDVSEIKQAAIFVLESEKILMAMLTLSFVHNSLIKTLNKKFLLKDSTTDVLAFNLSIQKKVADCLVGDIVISVDAALLSAKKLCLSFDEELLRYLIHGILHLIGYDDTTEIKRKKMWKRQEYLLTRVIRSINSINVSKYQRSKKFLRP